MSENIKLYEWDGRTAENYPPTKEQLQAFPDFYRARFDAAKVEHVRMQAAGSANLLAEHMGVTSDDQIIRGEHGAPSLKDDPRFISISHTGPRTVLAICDRPIGVDIEAEDSKQEYERIARRFFPVKFQALIEAAPEERKHKVFLKCWTQLEAALKAEGTGFTVPRETFPEVLEKYEIHTFERNGLIISIAT